ncbi:phosphofructokinase 4 [Actinidia rufa]|uniref:Phosphofructokinase 4 n=1 Tax=Actinidia rufa TaxID=165716 RepID=A0A7J0GX72_9ERIC|nr:phosphofructokinase 4 [Actinidia rufa]
MPLSHASLKPHSLRVENPLKPYGGQVIDKSFGFDTAVEEAQRAINAAHVEVKSVENGVGIVKLMGRYSGFIAMFATLASRDVECCLIPESPFYLEGQGGLFEFIEQRLKENGHMVIVLAEGAGGRIMLLRACKSLMRKMHWGIDPTYMTRAIPSNASDNIYCTLLARSAVHGANAGYTGFTVGPVNSRRAYIPIAFRVSVTLVPVVSIASCNPVAVVTPLFAKWCCPNPLSERVTETTNTVKLTDRMWARLLASTNQPSFLQNNEAMEEKLDGNTLDVINKMEITST